MKNLNINEICQISGSEISEECACLVSETYGKLMTQELTQPKAIGILLSSNCNLNDIKTASDGIRGLIWFVYEICNSYRL